MKPERIALLKTTWPDKVRVGTAYLINERWLITARHVIAKFGTPERIDVRLRGQDEPWQQVTLRWPTDEPAESSADLAILALKTPRSGTAPAAFAKPPSLQAEWTGHGFLADPNLSADKIWEEKHEGLSGKIYPPAKGERALGLTVESPVPTAEAWAGISGGPVFVAHHLVACISNATKKFEGNRIRAVPILQALPPEIRDELTGPGISDQAVAEIAAVLHRKGDLCNALGYFFEESARTPEQIGQQMVHGLPLAEALSRLRDVLKAKDWIRDYKAARAAAREVFDWLWPARSADMPVSADRQRKLGKVQAPRGSESACVDSWMASDDKGRAKLVISGDSSEVRGGSALRLPPETGLKFANVVGHLQKELRALFPDEYVVVSGDSDHLAMDLDGLLRLQELTRNRPAQRGQAPRSPYLEIGDYGEPAALEALIAEVKKLVPGLWVWRCETSGPDRDFRAIMVAVKFILGKADSSGDTDAVAD